MLHLKAVCNSESRVYRKLIAQFTFADSNIEGCALFLHEKSLNATKTTFSNLPIKYIITGLIVFIQPYFSSQGQILRHQSLTL